MKAWKKLGVVVTLLAVGLGLAACSSNNSKKEDTSASKEKDVKEITVGVCPGPYGDMINEVINPLMEEKGYKLKTKLFNDYVQPDKALNSKQIEANLMQHSVYLKKFAKDNNLELSAVDAVPTLGMGIYSKKVKSLDDIKEGSTVSLANDASNLARSLQLLAANKLITIDDNVDETKATVNDIKDNPKNLDFKTLEAGQLSRSLDNVDVALIPGNYSWSAELKPSSSLALEKLKEEYKNVVAVRTEDLDGDLGKAFKEVLESDAFKEAINKSDFKDFEKPDFWTK